MEAGRALELAEGLLAACLPERFAHVVGVGGRAERVPDEAGVLVQACIVHDIGYSPQVVETGFHPIDGARHLRRLGIDEGIVNLVAHHSCAHIEADLRGLRSVLDEEFPRDNSLPHDELCFCDMTTSPTGEIVTVDERLAEIRIRHGEGSIASQFLDVAEPQLRAITAKFTTSETN